MSADRISIMAAIALIGDLSACDGAEKPAEEPITLACEEPRESPPPRSVIPPKLFRRRHAE
jgi:hypothetical protein